MTTFPAPPFEEFQELNGIDKTIRIKKSVVLKVVIKKTQYPEKPYVLDIKTNDGKFDDNLFCESKEKAEIEANKIT